MDFWRDVSRTGRQDYATWGLLDEKSGLEVLKLIFPTAEADKANFVLFSTAGVHGSYRTLEQAQQERQEPEDEDEGESGGVTFMILQPRLVLTRYGVVYPESEEDFAFLKKLRATSWKAMSEVGKSA
jgi:hypothetical protein